MTTGIRIRRFLRLAAAACALFGGALSLHAQSLEAKFRIHYVINRPEVDTTFADNAARIDEIRRFLQEAESDTLLHFVRVDFRGTASPDGGYEFNRWLSESRLQTLKELIGAYITIPAEFILNDSSDIPWNEFRDRVADSDLPDRDLMLTIIDENAAIVPWFNGRHIDFRLLKLKRLRKGRSWESLKEPILSDLRYGEVTFSYYRERPKLLAEMDYRATYDLLLPPPSIVEHLTAPAPLIEQWLPRLYLKTNFIALALLSANAAVEADLAPHWSVTLPVSYSGCDYFIPTLKFRNLAVQPEFRYWFPLKHNGRYLYNDGLFAGAHFTLAYYNLAFNGIHRYQDREGSHPALGGGLSLGYRMPVSRNGRWHMEFALGAGAYAVDYNIFENTPEYRDGIFTENVKRTYIGPDQAAVTISYSFDQERRRRPYTSGTSRKKSRDRSQNSSKKGGRR